MRLLPMASLVALTLSAASPLLAATFDPNAIALTLADDGRSIRTIAGAGTGTVRTLNFAGGLNISLDDIDYRPATGGIFGYDNETDTVYSIDLATGNATAQVTRPGATSSNNLGFDFNNAIDAARVVTDVQENVVFAPNALPSPTLTPQTPLFYKAGDVNFGKDPTINMNAYTNAFAGTPTTLQYVIDTGLDILGTLNNNMGDLTTIGSLFLNGSLFDAQGRGGFDILSLMPGQNTAYALFSGKGAQALYTFDLTPDSMGRINLFEVAQVPSTAGQVAGLTVLPAPALAPVPLPASALLLMGGLGVLGAAARRRRPA